MRAMPSFSRSMDVMDDPLGKIVSSSMAQGPWVVEADAKEGYWRFVCVYVCVRMDLGGI